MKYLMTFIIGLALSLSFVACGNDDKKEASSDADTGSEVLDTADTGSEVLDTADTGSEVLDTADTGFVDSGDAD